MGQQANSLGELLSQAEKGHEDTEVINDSSYDIFAAVENAGDAEEEEEEYEEEEVDETQEEDLDEEEEETEEEEDDLDEEEEEESEEDLDEEETEEEEEDEAIHPVYSDVIREENPDLEFNSREDYENAVVQTIQNLKTQNQEHEVVRSGVLEIAGQYPEFGTLIAALKKGESWRTAIVRTGILPEDLQSDESDDDLEAIALAKHQEKQRRIENANRLKELENNQRESNKRISAYQKKHNIKDSDMKRMFDTFKVLIAPLERAEWTDEALDAIRLVTNYDSDIKTARTAGEIVGRNQKIKADKRKRIGDKMPRTTSAAAPSTTKKPKQKPDKMISDINEFADRPTTLTGMLGID